MKFAVSVEKFACENNTYVDIFQSVTYFIQDGLPVTVMYYIHHSNYRAINPVSSRPSSENIEKPEENDGFLPRAAKNVRKMTAINNAAPTEGDEEFSDCTSSESSEDLSDQDDDENEVRINLSPKN